MTDRKQRAVVIIGIIAIIISVVFSLTENDKKSGVNTSSDIEGLIDAIDGVDEPRVIIYTADEDICGIAVVYSGDKSFATKNKIYELISSLYGISYSRIYVGN